MKQSSHQTHLGRKLALFGFVALAILLTIGSILAMAQKADQPGWRFELEQGKSMRSNLAITNRCSAPHRFRVKNKIKYLRFEQPTESILVGANSTKELGVQFDATGLKSQKYRDKLIVECPDCKKEKGCRQDREELLVEMIVLRPAESQIVNRVSLNCIPRGQGRFGSPCDGPGYSCLVMFPSRDPWPASIAMTPEVEKQSLPGTAYVSQGARPSLHYEFASSPSRDVKTFPLDRDFPLDNKVSNLLGYSSVTILKGKYEVDRKKGKFGGITFSIEVSGRAVRDDEIGTLHNEALAFLYKHPDFLKVLKGRKKGLFTSGDVSQIQKLIKQFALGKGFSETETDNANNSLSKFLADVGAINSLGEISLSNQYAAKAQPIPILAAQKGYLSQTLAEEIVKVQQMALDKKDLKGVLEYVEKQARPRLREKDDIRRMDLFVNVSNKSHQFWGSEPELLKPGSGTIIADGAGAAYGLLLGPIGSIFYGTLFSVIANESD